MAKKIYKEFTVYLPFYVEGKENGKCVGCGDKVDVDRPFHFPLCFRCRKPIWRMVIRPNDYDKVMRGRFHG
jgi:hypothetical protein